MAILEKKQTGPRYDGLRVSREEYLDLEDDGCKYDMIGGILYVTPGAHFRHGQAYGNFFFHLKLYLKDRPIGEITQETDILLPDGGDVLRPDLSLILKKNLLIVKTHIHGAPDLICEVLSDATASRDLGEKQERYLACGVQEYWIVDPRDKTMQLWMNHANLEWKKRSGNLLESLLLPGFTIEVPEFWE